MSVAHLTARNPELTPAQLLASLEPARQFAAVSFDTYLADPTEPSQAAALAALRAFSEEPPPASGRWLRRRAAPPEDRSGVYLDGGFGVGKTHLLASLWHASAGPKAFGTFVEYTNLVGALGFESAVLQFSDYRLICLDEFELDDPGDTMLMSTFLGRLVVEGVRLAATSNTLPDRLGEGRFAADDFVREIQGLSAHFDVLRIEGPDYRHRGDPEPTAALADDELTALAESVERAAIDDFGSLLDHLRSVHPSRYGALVADIDLLCLRQVRPLRDQADALRFVVLVDRLYDADVALAGSGMSMARIFAPDMLTGGYRKKYYRALSRIESLSRSTA